MKTMGKMQCFQSKNLGEMIPFRISCVAGLAAENSLDFCLPVKVLIPPLYIKKTLAEYIILC